MLAIVQVARDRYHTWTETFFLGACLFAGGYAVSDWFFFHPELLGGTDILTSARIATFAALLGLSCLILAALFILLFTTVYVDRMKRSYWGLAGISLAVLIIMWVSGIDTVLRPSPDELYIAEFNTIPFAVFLVYLLVYAGISNWNLYRVYKIVRQSSKSLGRRALGLCITFTLCLVLGILSNGYLGIRHITNVAPPFSTLLGLVAGSAYITLFPVGRERVSLAIRRFQARRYSIKAVFMTYEDGTLIGAKTRPGESVIDQDLFGATLDVIQNFMRTSFPILRGKSLSSISHGSYTLVVERARYAYLTVVLEGEETDQLRRQMRDLLLVFEDTNRRVLANWQGVPSDAVGTEQMLGEFFVEEPLVV